MYLIIISIIYILTVIIFNIISYRKDKEITLMGLIWSIFPISNTVFLIGIFLIWIMSCIPDKYDNIIIYSWKRKPKFKQGDIVTKTNGVGKYRIMYSLITIDNTYNYGIQNHHGNTIEVKEKDLKIFKD